MQTNINTELFRRYAPKKKLEIIEKLTDDELLAITPATLIRMVKETPSVDKYIISTVSDTEPYQSPRQIISRARNPVSSASSRRAAASRRIRRSGPS